MVVPLERPLDVLILEDVRADAELLERALSQAGIVFKSRCVDGRDGFLRALADSLPDIILADHVLPGFTSRWALDHVRQRHPYLPVIIVTGMLDDAAAIALVEAGATACVLKRNLVRLPSVVTQAVSHARSIEALRRSEQELRVSEERYRRLFESARDGILILDWETGRIVDANPAFADLVGAKREECRGRQLWDFGAFVGAEEERAAFAKVKRSGYVRYEDLSLEAVGGRRIDAELTASVYEASGGRVVQCLVRDVTDQRLALWELEASEQRYRRLFETARDGILILDADSGQILDVNPYFAGLLGFAREECRGRQLWQLGAYPSAEANARALAQLEAAGQLRSDDMPLQTKSGRYISVEFIANVYEVNGERVVQCNVHDVTERRRAQKEIEAYRSLLERTVGARTTELARANAALRSTAEELESFAFSVSHDLCAPLRAVIGFARILEEKHADGLDEEGRRLLGMVREGAAGLEKMLGDVLDYSHITRSDMVAATVDMEELARQVAGELAQAAAASGRRLDIEIGRLPQVVGDRGLLQRVWANLLGNAVKFTAPKSQARIGIGATMSGGEVIYHVRDTGVGFDMELSGRLFNAFQRLHGQEFAGSGIGLAIVKRILSRHRGRVWAEGRPGEGATFYFALPRPASVVPREILKVHEEAAARP